MTAHPSDTDRAAAEASAAAEAGGAAVRPGRFPVGTFTPSPARGRLAGMLAAQSGVEIRLALRNGEQVLLTLLIPLALLCGLTWVDVVPLPAPRVASVTPAVLALAVLSTAFTSQAISFGFDRRYGVIRRLAATAVPRWLLVAGRLVAVLGVVVVQLLVLGGTAFALGWRPALAGLDWALLLVLLGCGAFGALGLLLGGTLRAEIVLAVANIVWFALLLGGGIMLPPALLPAPLRALAPWLPSEALAEGLRAALVAGRSPGAHAVLVLLGWAAVAGAVATRTVRLR